MNDRKTGASNLTLLSPQELLAILEPHLAGLLSFLKRDTRDPDLAADLLQDALVTALEKIRSGELKDLDRVAGFVYRVALNHWRNQRRKARRTAGDAGALPELVDESPGSAIPESLHRAQWGKALRTVLAEMPSARDRELLVRFYLDQEDKDELCASLGVSAVHFNRIAFRARERLRVMLMGRGLSAIDLFWAGLLLCCMAVRQFGESA